MRSYKDSNYVIAIQMSTILKGTLIFIAGLLSVFSMIGILTSLNPEFRITSNSLNQAASSVKGETLYKMLALENRSFNQILPEEDQALPSLSSMFFQVATNVSFEDPRSFLGRELPGFSIFDGDILVAGEGTDFTNMPIESVPPPEALEAENEAPLKNVGDLKETNQKGGDVMPPLSTGNKRRSFFTSHIRGNPIFLIWMECPNRIPPCIPRSMSPGWGKW